MKYEELLKLLAKNVIKLREYKNMTQEDLANRSGLAVRHVQKIEYGQANITLQTISKLADAFKVKPLKLFED